MGHAGAFLLPGEPDALTKIKYLSDAGVTIVNHPAKFGDAMKTLFSQSGRSSSGAATSASQQRRGLHTMRRIRPSSSAPSHPSTLATQKRTLYIHENAAFNLLRERGINASDYSGTGTKRLLAITIDRNTRSPCITASPTSPPTPSETKSWSFPYTTGPPALLLPALANHLGLSPSSHASLGPLLENLFDLFKTREAFLLEMTLVERLGALKVVGANFGFDDAARARQAEIHSLAPASTSASETPSNETEQADPIQAAASAAGIVYIPLPSPTATIGTLVNGAGLAMNTVDALQALGGEATNFLDTGGKATSATVRASFEIVLADPRVKVVFVNIFGGLTLGDMIAEGVVSAFKEGDVRVPVVVRVRGTREAEGRRIVSFVPFYLVTSQSLCIN